MSKSELLQNLLIEIGCEELPPKALKKLATAFLNNLSDHLDKANLAYENKTWYASPRRLAVSFTKLQNTQEDREIEKRGPAVKAAFDENNQPTQACIGFARSCGLDINDIDKLETFETGKGAWLFYKSIEQGKSLNSLLPEMINQSLKKLPIPKRMRWGDKTAEFVRPVHWAVVLYGSNIIDCEILGIKSGNQSYGHRFHHPEAVTINSADEYLSELESAQVMADYDKRKSFIKNQAIKLAESINGKAILDNNLLDEVCSIVEWPVPLLANFDENFLDVPKEALISAMQDHQKCFPIINPEDNKLLSSFITISNINSQNPNEVIHGNERVMRARLSDAEFFYQTDLKHSLSEHVNSLANIIFQAKLGSLLDKTQRIAELSSAIASKLEINKEQAVTAAELCKADLLSDMVGEFPELQGIMGEYYANKEGYDSSVGRAIREHYQPRFAKDDVPESLLGATVALADKLDTLVGIFGIDQAPTGEKDPFALRRAALGIIRIIIQKELNLDLKELISLAVKHYNDKLVLDNSEVINNSFEFIYDRLRAWYQEQDIQATSYLAVAAKQPTRPLDFHRRVLAVENFRQLPAAASLAAANKRVSRLLIKENKENISREINSDLFENNNETELAKKIEEQKILVSPLFANANYSEGLRELANMQESVDRFFDNVMVMADNENLRNNRLALLANLRDLFLEVADISIL